MANVTPAYKKWNRSDKDNYRPVCILPNLSKIFERCLCKQISTFLKISFLNIIAGLGKNIVLNTAYIGVLLTNLSKASTFFVYCKTQG